MILRHDSPLDRADQEASGVPGGAADLHDRARRRAPYVERTEPRPRALAQLRGLRSAAERKHSWQLAEGSGEATPDAFQPRLRRALWDPEAVRDERRRYLIQHLGDPEAVLVSAETGVLQKGRHSAGVARQSSGPAGRLDKSQMGVFLGSASRLGQAVRDRARDRPKAWTNDAARCQPAGSPADRRFSTTPQRAQHMRQRALAAGVPGRWVTGDSVYGHDRRLRLWLEAQPWAYGWAVSGPEDVWRGWPQRQGKTLLAALPEASWTRVSAGDGAQGPRWYAWQGLPWADPVDPQWRRWLLVRRRRSAPTDLTAQVVVAPQAPALEEVGRIAGSRWTMARGFEAAKGEVGLEHYEVRSWTGWYRHLTLVRWAYARLTVLRAGAMAVEALKNRRLTPPRGSRLAACTAGRGRACR